MDKKGSGFIPISVKYLRHRLLAGYRNGHGVHSPYVYDLVRNVIFNKYNWQVPDRLKEYHQHMRNEDSTLLIRDLGAGSRVTGEPVREVSSVARKSSVTKRQGALLYRIAHWYRPTAVIEAGTGIGISTSYLAAGADNAIVTTIEGSPEKYNFAQSHTEAAESGGLEFLLGEFDTYFDELVEKTPDHTLFFIDGDHRYRSTIRRIRSILGNALLKETIIILDDIHWSDEMEQAWKESLEVPGVDISLDLFHVGILIRRPGIARQHFRISF